MDNTSDKKPLLSTNSSRGSGEGSNSKKDSKKESKTTKESNKESIKETAKETTKETPPVSGDKKPQNEISSTPNRIVRPTRATRPFSTKTKGVYWILTIIHLIVLLCVLFAMSYGLLQLVFFQTKDGPLYWGTGSFIGGVPAIMYEPFQENKIPDSKKLRQITFSPNDTLSFKFYVDRLRNLTLNATEKLIKDNVAECSDGAIRHHIWTGHKTQFQCRQDVMNSLNDTDTVVCDPKNSPNMGYDMATPCILIRLTKLLGFFPKSGKQEDGKPRPAKTVNSCDEFLTFECSAHRRGNETEIYKINVGTQGIPFCRFPFWNQKNYVAPYVIIRPADPLPVGETVIKCSPELKSLKTLSNGKPNKVEIIVEIVEGNKEELSDSIDKNKKNETIK